MVDGSGGNNQDDYSKKREQLATELLEKAEKWAQFVHDDIEQLQKEGVLSETKMNALAAKIDEDTQRIKTEGKAHADSIQLAGNTEETHLNKLSDLAKKQPKDFNQWRADEMKRMQWEIDWLKDDSEELRKKLLDLWQTLNGDEEKVMKEAEKMITTDPNSKTLYPRRAVEHHLKILTIHQQAHSLEHEVLQRGRTHAQAILNHVNHERFSPIKNTGEL